ncbi:MAG: GDSL-type esterase/lipase family protein [Terriglobia bacterium]
MKRVLLLGLMVLMAASSLSADVRLRAGERIVTLGDSITQAGGYQAFMQKVFDRFYPELKIQIINAGIGGHKSPDMAARLRHDVIDQNPTVVTISCGVNDVWHGFYQPPRGVELDKYTELMTQMVRELKAATTAQIYLLTPTVIHENLFGPENLKLAGYCEAVRKIAIAEKVQLVDLNSLFSLVIRSTQIGGAPDFHPTSDGVHMKLAGDFLMAAGILRAMGIPMGQILQASEVTAPAVSADDPHFQYWGRWNLHDAGSTGAVTVNTGSTLLFRFQGNNVKLHFTTTQYPQQFPTLWLQIDEGEWKVINPAEEMPLAKTPLAEGPHRVTLVVKGFREWENRWDNPLVSAVIFRGVTLGEGGRLLDPPQRPLKLIEYLGDSITEGILVHKPAPEEKGNRGGWPRFSDGRQTWAYQSALMVGAEPRIVGFGRLGLTVNANGGVPPAMQSFPFIYEGVPIDTLPQPDVVVINMGSNDRNRASSELFAALYKSYVETIRKKYPTATILCLRPFIGAHAAAIEETVRRLADPKVRYVDTTGWIESGKHTTDQVHPNLEGNRIAAEKMAIILKEVL